MSLKIDERRSQGLRPAGPSISKKETRSNDTPRAMELSVERTPPVSDLRHDLERHIHSRTGRRVRGLAVELRPERVILRGQATCYYVKQLAQHAALDLLRGARVQNAIAVHSAA